MVAAVPFMKGKVDVVDYLRSKEGEGLSWSSVVVGPFTEYVSSSSPGCIVSAMGTTSQRS
jgi:hypothetical protein